MKKKVCALLAVALCAVSLIGCRSSVQTSEDHVSESSSRTVDLVVWGAAEDEALLNQIISDFKTKYQGQADFRITFEAQGESDCKDALLSALEESADVFAFADDQLNALAAAGALNPVENPDEIKKANLPGAIEAASVGGTLYAYPLTSDNGYFLYYNKQYFTEGDIGSLNRILEIAAENEKLFSMDWSSAWYVYSFFGNTGLEVGLNQDGITNYCTWNQKDGAIRGLDVAQAMVNIAKSPGFISQTDTEFLAGAQNGSVIAGVSGVWNAVALEEAWGENLGASKLPTYACRGRQVQMASFSGCKLIGVNAYSGQYEWAVKLAEWISNEQNQKLRFKLRGQGPSNTRAAASPEIQDSPAITALLEQSGFSQLQRIGGNFWEPVTAFAQNMAAGNPDGADLQQQLDKMVDGITAR